MSNGEKEKKLERERERERGKDETLRVRAERILLPLVV